MRIPYLWFLLVFAAPASGQIIATQWGRRVPTSAGQQMSDHVFVYDQLRDVSVAFDAANPTTIQEWDGSCWTIRPLPAPPVPAAGVRGAYDLATNTVLLYGGMTATGPTSLQYRWDGNRLLTDGLQAPPAREGHTLASWPGGAILFGGRDANGISLGDTWTWSGTRWTQLCVAGPSPRGDHAFTFSYADGVAYLFGGRDSNGVQADFWSFDGTSWNQPFAFPSPRAREHAELIEGYGGYLLLIGGVDANGGTIHEVQHYARSLATWQDQGGVIRCRPRNATALDWVRDEILIHGGLNSSQRELWSGIPEPIQNGGGVSTAIEYGGGSRLQLSTDTLPRLGALFTLDFGSVDPATSALLVVIGFRGLRPIVRDQLQVESLFLIPWPGPAPIGPPPSLSLAVPNNTMLSGSSVFFQALAGVGSSGTFQVEFSSSIEAVLGL